MLKDTIFKGFLFLYNSVAGLRYGEIPKRPNYYNTLYRNQIQQQIPDPGWQNNQGTYLPWATPTILPWKFMSHTFLFVLAAGPEQKR